ncbi:MAG: DUF2723 domain-containing protein [Ignavibacteria bacterium]|nr:DUF2723 domain-containing protein [Ignavibacteria bacterium]
MKLLPEKQAYRLLFQVLSLIIPLLIYVFTLAPTISYTDSGELALACIKLAIAHPTGYPLFTMLGKIFYLLHFGEEAYILNLMCAIFSAFSVFIFFNVLVLLLNYLKQNFTDKKFRTSLNELNINIISLFSAFLLAFSRTFWDSANSIEVWSLHNLFITLLLYVFIKAITQNSEKHYLLFAYLLGLSFSNHLSTFFTLFGFLSLYFMYEGFNRISLKRILFLFIPFIGGLSVYIYLIIRANNDIITWIYPLDLYNLYYHITGKHFSGLMFKSFKSSIDMLGNFIEFFPKEYFFVPLLISIVGIFYLWKVSKKYFAFTILLFIVNILLAINYEILDFENYYYLTPICVAIWFAFGLVYLIGKFKLRSYLITIISIILLLFPLTQNYSKVNESDNYVIHDYYMNFVKFLPEDAVVVTEGMDVAMLASFYYQMVKGIRKDVVIFNDNLVTSAPWYINFLEQHYKNFYEKNKNEFDIYFKNLLDYHYSKKENFYNKELINSYITLYKSILEKNDVFFTQEFVRKHLYNSVLTPIAKEYNLIPYGLFFRATKDSNFIDDGSPEFNYQVKQKSLEKLIKEDPFYTIIAYVYYNSYLSRANYLIQNMKFNEAEKLIRKAEAIIPEENKAKQMLNTLNQLKNKQK